MAGFVSGRSLGDLARDRFRVGGAGFIDPHCRRNRRESQEIPRLADETPSNRPSRFDRRRSFIDRDNKIIT
jgi:hypothetical protein